jgi:hypothetical protein
MKVISILQPWASLVALGHKKIETRSWNTKYRGELLIHASKKRLSRDEASYFLGSIINHVPGRMYEEIQSLLIPIDTLPYGAIIGKVELQETFSTNDIFNNTSPLSRCNKYVDLGGTWGLQGLTNQELAFGDYSPNRFGWLLSDPILFKEPIPCKGQLGIWNLPAELESLIINQNK